MSLALVSNLVSQADFAAALLDPGLPCPAGLRAWNGSAPHARLAVHRNNVVSSLIAALADNFPVTQQLVGATFFGAMASVFVRQAPPRSRLLAFYGAGLPDFIDRFEAAASVPYLADVARIEIARVRAYHAADAEPVAAQAVSRALASGEDMPALRLQVHPSLHALASRHAVVAIWAAHQGMGELEQVDVDEAEEALVLRQGLDVVVLRAPPGSTAFVHALQQGHALGHAAGLAGGVAAVFDLAATLTLLLGQGALTSIYLPQGLPA